MSIGPFRRGLPAAEGRTGTRHRPAGPGSRSTGRAVDGGAARSARWRPGWPGTARTGDRWRRSRRRSSRSPRSGTGGRSAGRGPSERPASELGDLGGTNRCSPGRCPTGGPGAHAKAEPTNRLSLGFGVGVLPAPVAAGPNADGHATTVFGLVVTEHVADPVGVLLDEPDRRLPGHGHVEVSSQVVGRAAPNQPARSMEARRTSAPEYGASAMRPAPTYRPTWWMERQSPERSA